LRKLNVFNNEVESYDIFVMTNVRI